jgi:hypothetical protein
MNDKMEEKDITCNKINKLERTEQQAQLSLGGIYSIQNSSRDLFFMFLAHNFS